MLWLMVGCYRCIADHSMLGDVGIMTVLCCGALNVDASNQPGSPVRACRRRRGGVAFLPLYCNAYGDTAYL